MEFLVEFELDVPVGATAPDVTFREATVASAADSLARRGHLLRLWMVPSGWGEDKILGLYRVEDVNELDEILDNLPFHQWVNVVITKLEFHPNDPFPSERFNVPHR